MKIEKIGRPLPWLFLTAGLLSACIAYFAGSAMVERETGRQIEMRTNEARHNVERQIIGYAEVLRGLDAQFAANPDLALAAFRHIFQTLQVERRFPGIQALGFAPRVVPEAKPFFDEDLQRRWTMADGTSLLTSKARVAESDSYIVQYVEPIEKNQAGIGFDHATNMERRAAIERARDTGALAASGRVRLFVAPGNVDGIVFYMPLYRDSAVPSTIEERREKFLGIVFIAIRLDDMLHGVFAPQLLEDLQIDIIDSTIKPERHPADENVIFSSRRAAPTLPFKGAGTRDHLKHSKALDVAGRTWVLRVTATKKFMSTSRHWLPTLAALAGVLLSLLAFSFMRALEYRRQAAENQARDARQSLELKDLQLSDIMDSIDEVLWSFDLPDGKLRYVSSAVERVYGHPEASFYENHRLWLECVHPEDKQRVIDLAKNIPENGRETLYYRIIRRDGAVRWIRYAARFVEGVFPGQGRIDSVGSDVTEQHLASISLRHSYRALRAIHACDKLIAVAEDEETLLQGVCDLVVQAGYRMAWVGLLNGIDTEEITIAGVAGEHQDYLDMLKFHLEHSRRDETTTIGGALRTMRPVIANNVETDSRLTPWRDAALLRGFRSKIVLPLYHDAQTLGVLNVYASESDAFDQAEVDLLAGLAQGVTVAIQAYRRKLAQREATATLHLYKQAIDACANPIVITTAEAPDYPVEYVNPAFERVTGYSADDMIGQCIRILYREDIDQPGLKEIQARLIEKREAHAVVRNYRKDGIPFWSEVYIAPVKNETGEIRHFVSAQYDITENKRYEAELEFRANYDTLTTLPNRNLLRDRLSQAIVAAQHAAQPLWVAFIDLDRFNFFNETLGHQTGDLILKTVSDRLRNMINGTDTVARWAGDKFALVLSRSSPPGNDVTHVLQNIITTISSPLAMDGHELTLSCSIGIACYPDDGIDAETLIKNADLAVRLAKEKGGDNFQFFTPVMNARALERLCLEQSLRNALKCSELVLFYQPQVDLLTGRVVGMEALCRWQHPQHGIIPPGRFIGLAEETGLIVPIGEWVLRTACTQAALWRRMGVADLRVAVNLSARQFADESFVSMVATVLEETGLPGEQLDIELTESLVMSDVNKAIETLTRLKVLGVQLSIDDFGTGYSSLSYLKRFPIDVLKIDRSFISDITTDPDNATIAEAIISMAHSLGLKTIAEGVETEAQCEFLSRNMCDEIQGFLFSEPLTSEKMSALLSEQRNLPKHLLRLQKSSRTLLLVDDEPNILAALKRQLRGQNCRILTASNGKEGLDLLAKNTVDVIVTDQRMPGMMGVEFLRIAKMLYPDTVRIVLSGFTELQSVTDAINEGAVYKFLTKPWDGNQLKAHILDALQHKEMEDENHRLYLELKTVNQELKRKNRRLEDLLPPRRQSDYGEMNHS